MLNLFFNMDFSAVPASTIGGAILVPFILISIITIIFVGIKRKLGAVGILFNIFFALYIFTLIEILFFSIPVNPSEIVAAREFSHPQMNLIPLRDILSEPLPIIIRNLVGNIIIFIPLGFFLPILIHRARKIKAAAIIVVVSALVVELIQFIGSFVIFQLNWKIVDIDDVLMNIIGGMIGIVAYYIFNQYFKLNPEAKSEPNQH